MQKLIIQISDLHYVSGAPESYGVVLSALFEDIAKKYSGLDADKYLLFSGDLVKQGDDLASYNELFDKIVPRFCGLGFPRDRRICIPGNHDLSRQIVTNRILEHEGIIGQCVSEKVFNDHVRGRNGTFVDKFANYLDFERRFAAFGVGENGLGMHHSVSEELSIYCANSAYFSAGGLTGVDGPIKEEGRLVIDTRGLHEWVQGTKGQTRALIMHHPLEWFAPWCVTEIRALLGKSVHLLVTGHTHEQEIAVIGATMGTYAHAVAPALFTSKSAPLGYAAISLLSDGMPRSIEYRQWVTKSQTFVTGTSFSSSDDGIVRFTTPMGSRAVERDAETEVASLSAPSSHQGPSGGTQNVLDSRLATALEHFYKQPTIFVDPVLSDKSEITSNQHGDSAETYGVLDLLEKGFPSAVHAPPQFGLTCVARHFCAKVFRAKSVVWLYLDAVLVKPHRKAVAEAITTELAAIGCTMAAVQGVVIDSVKNSDKDSQKLVIKVADLYPGIEILFMRSNDFAGGENLEELGGHKVRSSFLWTMSRTSMRKVVADYNDIRPLGDEDLVTSRLAQDLEMMNIHRTPLNCLTLLKVSESQYEDSPVNRAELIKRILQLIFNGNDIPTYKSRPDVKDCEFVLGYFCEGLIRAHHARFTQNEFRDKISRFCKSNLLDIDVDLVFDVLVRNNILVSRGYGYEFKFLYWVMYFSAQRMCQSDDFRGYIFFDQRYSSFPEIIEFYTGINRSMNEAVAVLVADLRTTTADFDSKIALPQDFDVFSQAQWQPTDSALEQMREETIRGVTNSNLPAAVKDQYADKAYDSSRPYVQDIGAVLQGFSYNKMLQGMRAASKALRNSDYVSTPLKMELLGEILKVWQRAATVILVLVPALTRNGEAAFDDVRYVLGENFPEEHDERFEAVLQEIPNNISNYFQDDLFSFKMGPLFSQEIGASQSKMARHLLALVLVRNRPRGWSEVIKGYVTSLPKNSFYLLDLYKRLQTQYMYGYMSETALSETAFLIKMSAAKHVTGAKDLGVRKVEQIASKISGDVVPERRVNESGELLEQEPEVDIPSDVIDAAP